MWLPRFACPECRHPAPENGSGKGAFACAACGAEFGSSNGIYHFLSRERAEAASRFERQYRVVRELGGYRHVSADYYRKLPSVAPDDPHATEWRIRRESFAHLQRHALPGVWQGPIHVLDLGAGNGWLSHRLAADGHFVVAVDRLDDEADGLGACRHYFAPFAVVQADFDRLPFEPSQFDMAVFDGSLHYAADPAATLGEAARMLAPGGTIVVMDSPMFGRDRDGHAMVADQVQQMETVLGIGGVLRPGPGYLTFEGLEAAARQLGMRARFIPSRGPLAWRVGRQIARIKLGRSPAAFGVWVATR
jgi:SAM-dependent methyltransferase